MPTEYEFTKTLIHSCKANSGQKKPKQTKKNKKKKKKKRKA